MVNLDHFYNSRQRIHTVSTQDNIEKTAKRGVLFITTAKIWFLFAGLLLQLLLPRAFGSRDLFGMWTLVMAWISGLNNVMVTGTIQTVAHFGRSGLEAAEHAKANGLKLQFLFGALCTLVFLLGAPLIAKFEHDVSIINSLRLASAIVFCYSIYAVFVGTANGLKQFHKQAGLDMLFATLRISLVLGVAWATHSVLGSVGGFVGAAVVITLLSIVWVGWPKATGPAPFSFLSMLGYLVWIVLYLIPVNLWMFVDVYLLKRLCTGALMNALHVSAEWLKGPVDTLVAIYGAAQNIARLPYQLMIAATFVIFPLLSRAAYQQNPEQTKRYIAATLRYSLLVVGILAVGLGVRPQGTLRLLYAPEYAGGSTVLALLLTAYVMFAMLSVVGTILNSLGYLRWTLGLSWGTLLLTCGFVYLSIRNHIPMVSSSEQIANDMEPLRAAAQGMVMGMTFGLGSFLLALWKLTRVTFAPLSLARVALATTAGLFLGWLWKPAGSIGFLGSQWGTLLCATLSALVYVLVLVLSKEFSFREIVQVRRSRSSGADDAATSHQ